MDEIKIDRFGPDVHTYAGDMQNFCVIEEVAVGKVLFNWIFGFEGRAVSSEGIRAASYKLQATRRGRRKRRRTQKQRAGAGDEGGAQRSC